MMQRWKAAMSRILEKIFLGFLSGLNFFIKESRERWQANLIFILLCLIVYLLVQREWFSRTPLLEWLEDSVDPHLGLAGFSMALVGLVYVLLPYMLVIKVRNLEIITKGIGERPLTLPAVALGLGVVLIFFFVRPACSPPAVFIVVKTGTMDVRLTPGETLALSGPSANVSAWSKSQDDPDHLVCTWTVLPESSASVVSPHACDTTIFWHGDPAKRTLLVNARKRSCDQAVNAQVYLNP